MNAPFRTPDPVSSLVRAVVAVGLSKFNDGLLHKQGPSRSTAGAAGLGRHGRANARSNAQHSGRQAPAGVRCVIEAGL
jgi:hypothetical protein